MGAVYHFAAAVGMGQSMYEIAYYTSVNNLGTAVLLEVLSKQPVKRLIVASSMSVYGEGLFRELDGRVATGQKRTREQLQPGLWIESELGAWRLPSTRPSTTASTSR